MFSTTLTVIHKESSFNVKPTKILSDFGGRCLTAWSTFTHWCKLHIVVELRIDETVEFHMSLKCFEKCKVILEKNRKLFFVKLWFIFRLIDCIAGGIEICDNSRKSMPTCSPVCQHLNCWNQRDNLRISAFDRRCVQPQGALSLFMDRKGQPKISNTRNKAEKHWLLYETCGLIPIMCNDIGQLK